MDKRNFEDVALGVSSDESDCGNSAISAERGDLSSSESDTSFYVGPNFSVHVDGGRTTGVLHHVPAAGIATGGRAQEVIVAFFASGNGLLQIRQNYRSVALMLGDITLIDGCEPYSIDANLGVCECLYFRVPSSTLLHWLPMVEHHFMQKVVTTQGWGTILGNYLATCTPQSLTAVGGDSRLLKVLPDHIASLLRNALLEQANSSLQDAARNYGRSRKLFRQIVGWLRENFTDPTLSLESVAAHFHLSSRQLARVVQKESEDSLPHILTRMRIERAADMLALPTFEHLTVAQIASAVGIPNAATFHRNFLRLVHTSPAQYRENAWEQRQDS